MECRKINTPPVQIKFGKNFFASMQTHRYIFINKVEGDQL